MSERVRPLRRDEAADAARRSALAFGSSLNDEAVERWHSRIDAGEGWCLEDDGVVAAQCRLLAAEHWFGGCLVPTLDIASVTVPPEHRRKGAARRLMEAAITRGAREGAGLSLLFPATTGFYRKLGWEHAGARTRYRVATADLPVDGPVMRPAGRPTDWPAIRACHDSAASRRSGPAARPAARWDDLWHKSVQYVLDAPDAQEAVAAYVLYEQRHDPGEWQFTCAIADWAATTPQGLRAVLGLAGDQRSMAKDATFIDGRPSAWSALVAEQNIRVDGDFFWMARGLDLGAAVAARGFPSALGLAVTLRVDDPWLPWEPQPQRLEVADGRGQLSPVDRADVRLDPRAVGPLFTGFRSPAELAVLGLMRGPDSALELLAAAFAGPAPMLYDFF